MRMHRSQTPPADSKDVAILSDSAALEGCLTIPAAAIGVVLFAHGSGSSRMSPRNSYVARALQSSKIGTLLFDLLTEAEAEDRENVFDVDFLGHRLLDATRWLRSATKGRGYPIGYFGASTGAAAALIAAAQDRSVAAIVSRGGRPDLAMKCLARVAAPTLLIVGGEDDQVIGLNQKAYAQLNCEKALEIVPGATHLFEEPGTLDEVVRLAAAWFVKYLADPAPEPYPQAPEYFEDRAEAGRRLGARLLKFRGENPIVIGIPRGGVPVAMEVARALGAPLDIVVVRKLGAPDQPELGIGAVVDGGHPQSVLNDELVREIGVSREYLEREVAAQLKEIQRRNRLYRGGRLAPEIAGRTVILIDDGIATGGSIRAALRGLRAMGPRRLVLAVPVAPAETIAALRGEADEVICLSTPEMFYAVGQFYRDFHQVRDREVVEMLEAANRGAPRGA